jgi:hypothetical protein
MQRADWKRRIVEQVLVKQKLAELDTKGLAVLAAFRGCF